MSDIPPPCYCGCPIHGGNCPCGCSIYEPQDGTADAHTCTPDHRSGPYQGQYQPKGGYTI